MKLDDLVKEGKIGDLLNWGIGKLSKNAPPRIEPVLKPRVKMVDGKPMEIKPDGTIVPYEMPKTKVDAPKVEPEAPVKEPGIVSRTGTEIKDYAKKHPVKTAVTGYTGGAAIDALTAPEGEKLDTFSKDLAGPISLPIKVARDVYKNVSDKPESSKSQPAVDTQQTVPANTSATAPENDPDWIPSKPEPEQTKESILQILKLSGQKPITERDNIMGIIKPKQIQTLTESAVNECGIMGAPGATTPASLSINATASNGEEVANMLASIMKLAGVTQVGQDMMPKNDNANMSMLKALQVMGGPIDEPMEPSEPDSMNSGVDYPADAGDDVSVAHGDIDNDGDHDMDDHEAEGDKVTVRNVDTGEEFTGKNVTQPGKITVRNVATGEEFDGRESTEEEYTNSPADPTDVPEWDPEKMVFRPNQAGQFDRMDGTMPKGVPAMEEVQKQPSLAESLFKEYEAFKNGQ